MRTARALTVSPSMLCAGGVPGPGGAWSGRGVPGPGGCLLLGGLVWGGACSREGVHAPGSVDTVESVEGVCNGFLALHTFFWFPEFSGYHQWQQESQ